MWELPRFKKEVYNCRIQVWELILLEKSFSTELTLKRILMMVAKQRFCAKIELGNDSFCIL